MSAVVRVKVLRRLHFGGRVYEADDTIKAAPLDAAMLVDSGRAALADPTDATEVEQARRLDVKRVLAQVGRPWREPKVQAPWQRIERL